MDCTTWQDGYHSYPPPYEECIVITEDWRIGTGYYEGDEWLLYTDEQETGYVKYWIRFPEEVTFE